MSYTAKTNWQGNDPVTESDLNRWEQGIKDSHEGLSKKIDATEKGIAGGVATLDENGKLKSGQLSIPSTPEGTTTTKGIVQLEDSTTSTSVTKAATPNAVKVAKDVLAGQIGTLANLNTTVKDSTVSAVNEVNTKVGTLSSLNTTTKTNLVSAVNELFTSASNGKAQMAAAITGKGVPASDADTFPTLATKIGQISTEVTGEVVGSYIADEAIVKGDRVQIGTTNLMPLPSLADSGTSGKDVSFSGDGTYLAVVGVGGTYIGLYRRNGTSYTKLANPATLPQGNALTVDLSIDGVYLAVTHNDLPFFSIYKRTGDVFSKLNNPSSIPTETIGGIAFSPDMVHLVVGGSTNQTSRVYKRSNDTFTLLGNLSTVKGNVRAIRFSSDGVYLIVMYSASLGVYKRSGDTFTYIGTLPTLPSSLSDVKFSNDTNYVALSLGVTPYVVFYKRSGDTFTKLTNPASLPGFSRGIGFSPDGVYVTVAQEDYNPTATYKRSDDTFTRVPSGDPQLNTTGNGLSYSPDGTQVVIATTGAPNPAILSAPSGVKKSAGKMIPNYKLGYAKTSVSLGQNVNVAVLFE